MAEISFEGVSFERVGRNNMVANRVPEGALSKKVMHRLRGVSEMRAWKHETEGIFVARGDDIVFLLSRTTRYIFGQEPDVLYQLTGIVYDKEVGIVLEGGVAGMSDPDILKKALEELAVDYSGGHTVSLLPLCIEDIWDMTGEEVTISIPEEFLSDSDKVIDWLADNISGESFSTASTKHLFAKEGEDTVLFLVELQTTDQDQDFSLSYMAMGMVHGEEVAVSWTVFHPTTCEEADYEAMAVRILGVVGTVICFESLSGKVFSKTLTKTKREVVWVL